MGDLSLVDLVVPILFHVHLFFLDSFQDLKIAMECGETAGAGLCTAVPLPLLSFPFITTTATRVNALFLPFLSVVVKGEAGNGGVCGGELVLRVGDPGGLGGDLLGKLTPSAG